ncbi:ribonuclease P protein component [methane-oxidizing endosymbiont of Gigantopelta aegis]|uniref:ribonuclease P protein component n=1 Tax=methane-oxidizing endosymbiont of Gigantopelta aegis TaxID=2794938 RepID=UPI0018DE2501|nr:ribonuclease P protein component [methane-oxidizing endosymbiont of Gigantopelta aegis]
MSAQNFAFPVQLRLRTANDYKKVFSNAKRSTDRYFTVLAIENNLGHPRLGLAIAKKNIKKAVIRNILKRAARESFRLQQHKLKNIDFVVLARKDSATASSEQLRKSLEKHWRKLNKQLGSVNSVPSGTD